jgi:hypothetical protein
MAVGAGISSTTGIATETTPGTAVAVTRFIETDQPTMSLNQTVAQGSGLRGGALVRRQARRNLVARQASGDLSFHVPTNGFGLFLQHMLGSFSATATSLGGGIFQQFHNTGSLAGKAFTMQIIKPDTTGVLTQQAFTYPGCKITGWEISVQQGQQVMTKLNIDALDELTPQNAVASTTLSALSAIAATTISTAATIPIGSTITIDRGLPTAEVRTTTNVSGAGPFTITVPALTYGHASGAVVSSATGVASVTAAALQAASFTSTVSEWDFSQGALVVGGTTSVVSNVWTMANGTTVANVRSVSLKGSNPLKVDRWGLGSAVRSEQLENQYRDYTAVVQVEYNSRLFYDTYAAGTPIALKLTFTNPAGSVLQFYAPAVFIEDGASPQVPGTDIIIQTLNLTILDDGVNASGLQAIYTSTDAAV